MALPARFEAENVARDMLFAQFGGQRQRFAGLESAAGAVLAAEAPFGRKRPAAAEQDIAPHRIKQRRARKQIDFDPLRGRNIDDHRGGDSFFSGVKLGFGQADAACFVRLLPGVQQFVAAAVEGSVAGRIDQHAVSGGREIERAGRMAVAGVHGRIAVDAERPFPAGVTEPFQVEPETVDILAGRERQFEAAAARRNRKTDLAGIERRGRGGQGGERLSARRPDINLFRRSVGFRRAERQSCDAGKKLLHILHPSLTIPVAYMFSIR